MTVLRRLAYRVLHLLRGARLRRELDEEIAFHLDRLADDLTRQGMDPKRARREARIRFGTHERVHERAREVRGLAGADDLLRDLRIAARGLRRSPLFSTTFIGTLALCIGLATASFAVADTIFLRPLPYPSPERLANAVLYDPAFGKSAGSTAADGRTWERVRDAAQAFERAAYSDWVRGVNLVGDQAADYVQQQRVGAGYFRTLGVAPQMGREFTPAEDVPDGPAVAVLAHNLWTGTFGGDPDIIGQTIRLKGEAHTVVGIMPPAFPPAGDVDVWTPLRPSRTGEGSGTNYAILVRVPAEMTLEEADARLAAIEAQPEALEGSADRRLGLVPLHEALTVGARQPVFILVGAIALLLFVGCANLAGLQMARAMARGPETAIRLALGSGRRALLRQVVVENLLLGLLGGMLGVAVASLAMAGLQDAAAERLGIWRDLTVEGRVLGAAFGVTAMATLIFGSAPLLHLSGARPGRLLVEGARVVGGGGHALRRALLVGQVALVTALLFGAGLLIRSYGHLERLDPGFEPQGLLAVQFSLDDARYADARDVRRLFEESLDGLHAIPGVSSAAVTLTLPYERALNLPFRRPGSEDNRVTNAVYVTPRFFETMEIPLRLGRPLAATDREGTTPVAVANEAFVARYLEGEPALGARLDMGFGGGDGVNIVGVAGNVQQSAGWGNTTQPVWETPTLYLSAAQASSEFLGTVQVWFSPHWVVRAPIAGPELVTRVMGVFREVDPDLPAARTAGMEEVMGRAFAEQRFQAAFLLAVAAFALLLSGIGLYGIVAHEVLERSREMGLRIALGATPGGATWVAGSSGLRLVCYGLAAGAIASVGVARLLQYAVWGVVPYDPITLAALLASMTFVAALASFVPAARIGRLDPARILAES